MDDGPSGRQGQPQPDLRGYRDRGRAERARLSVLAPDAQGSDWHPNLSCGGGDGSPARVRDDAVSSSRPRGRPRKDAGDGGGLRTDDDRERREREGSAEAGLRTLEDLGRPQFPIVEDGYRRAPAQGVAPAPTLGLREGDELSTSKFDRITDKALDALETCLDEHRTDADHLRLKNLQLQAAQTIISNRIKVDDTLLRRRQLDLMPKIIAMVQEEQQKLLDQAAKTLEQ